MCKYGVFSGPYFPAFGLTTEIYGVNLHSQSKYRKIRTRQNSVFRDFSRCENFLESFPFSVSFSFLYLASPAHRNGNSFIQSKFSWQKYFSWLIDYFVHHHCPTFTNCVFVAIGWWSIYAIPNLFCRTIPAFAIKLESKILEKNNKC